MAYYSVDTSTLPQSPLALTDECSAVHTTAIRRPGRYQSPGRPTVMPMESRPDLTAYWNVLRESRVENIAEPQRGKWTRSLRP